MSTGTDRTAHVLAKLLADARDARAEAERANRLKDEFLAILSHELRAPVTTMLLWEEVLREQPDPAIRAQALDAIRQSALVQARLVRDLLDVSRANSGKLAVDLRPVALGDVIEAALDAARPAALARQITLSHEGERAGAINGDIERLRQVLDSVLDNAITFTEPGGAVTVTTRTRAREYSVEIEDTGRGIPAELRELIFEPFHQRDGALPRRNGGLGLGLAVARHLVQLHGGTLRAASPGVGRGSTFTIRLPISNKQRSRTPSPGALPPSLAGRRVLLIDDDARVRSALTLLLQRTGVVLDIANSAAQGRARLTATQPDLIICDIAMPDEDGYAFMRTLRATGSSIPAIALTGHALQADATRALEAGFTLHLAKPVHFERLVASVASLISASAT